MFRVLAISAVALGLGTLSVIVAYVLRRGVRRSRVCTAIAAFGTMGLIVPVAVSAFGFLTHRDGASLAGPLWPTSITLITGQLDDSRAVAIVVFAVSTLMNTGVYGFLGLLVGSIWAGIRFGQLHSSGDQ